MEPAAAARSSHAPPPSWALLSYLAVLVLFLATQLLQAINLPFGLMASSLLVFGAAGVLLPGGFHLPARPLTALHAPSPVMLALGLLVGLTHMGFANLVMGAFREWLPAAWSASADAVTCLLVAADTPTRVVLVLAAGLAAPVGEELFFRGWLQPLLRPRLGALASVVLVAALFSFTHLDPVGFVPRVLLGVLFGLMRLWSGSLWPAIAAHAGHNLLSLLVLYTEQDPLADLQQPFEWGPALLWGAGSLVTSLALLALVHKQARLLPDAITTEPATQTARPDARRLLARTALILAGLVIAGLLLQSEATSLPGHDLLTHVECFSPRSP